MLKDKVKALFEEPACGKNQAKSEKDRKAGCSKPLTPGAAAGGCAFDGAKIALQPVTDAAHLVHGPLACEGNSWDNRGSGSSGSDLWRRSFTTDLTELDIVTGTGEKKLYKAVREITQRFSPAAVFVYSTCVTALIGDDIDAVCRHASAKYGVPVIPVNGAGFVGSKNLGNKIAGQALLDHVIGTVEPDDAGPTDVVILGEFNLAGEFWQVKPLLDRLGIRIRACVPGDARYAEIASAHTARVTMVVCSTALVGLARQMQERWGIPYFEGSFYGVLDTSESLRQMAKLLVARGAPADLIARTEALVTEEEARAFARLEPYKARLAGKRVLLNTGGVKSWSVVAALMEVGMDIVGTSVKKSTAEDRERIKILMREDPHMFESMAPRDLYRMLADGEADIMLSGGRTQFIALKARTPWLDINQERVHPYAGYDGMVELVKQIDLALRNPVWAQVRISAPWDDEGNPIETVVGFPATDALSPLPAGERSRAQHGGEVSEVGATASVIPIDRAAASAASEPDDSFAARHRKKFAESRVESSDPDYLARHRKKFRNTDADDMGEC
ncbi:nitrogenase iron-molybdenum cofactor biosynthesis protein NifE [Rhodoplanes sp. TEM]|uniref:Nitrogenase iron-molybdenum cofactor biosynthesis protein NifE n=1 Tax=Rhodoplanes tepidamans TaxID=200616 RepID=A0ABT5JFG8_RHOTP|nr:MULTISPECIES: nitrogenase iron-molybdenum cofactor biosynthesis protein NifE [Rhodoplanes]MDC7788416.1 nitrogenase iron-molybdenum cofactor biosynthesis protein NifE [Rhodoplanes tepidamans]MDC7985915.1 nitrogenase iron-molybdenum cofactor biosynthesis protein NifE [Rhodoplanes sp. TEM]MDQ0357085.1 nitrogenase molybdenum-cofactor synthesis protein NifE [Rhodoplanes tepidamans]